MSLSSFQLSPSVSEGASNSMVEAVASYIDAEEPRLVASYVWQIDEVRLAKHLQFQIEGDHAFAKHLDFKRKLGALWAEMPERRQQIGTHSAHMWGGIACTNEARVASCVAEIAAGRLPTFSGVTSWSKIASAAAPYDSAILDARVALSLNAIQLLSDGRSGVMFPMLPCRNKVIKRVAPLLQRTGQARGWEKLAREEVFPAYLALVRRCASKLQGSMQVARVEMVLFAMAEDLARRVEVKMFRCSPAETSLVARSTSL